MAKIRSFNISNIKKELAFASQTFTEAELRDMVIVELRTGQVGSGNCLDPT